MATLTKVTIGAVDVVDASGNLDPLNMVGMIHPFPTTSPPTGWIICEGQSINGSSGAYVRLLAAIGTTWGNGGGSAGDFSLPDLRGRFLRGRANGHANDPDRNSRTGQNNSQTGDNVGSLQAHSLRNQTVWCQGSKVGGPQVYCQLNQGPVFGSQATYASMTVAHFNGYRHTNNTSGGYGYHQMVMYSPIGGSNADTNPVNVSVMYCIKF
jgi:microcystin-dependent protein